MASNQPEALFQCTFPGCGLSYRRKEHLNRHSAKHSQANNAACPYCDRAFGRKDTLNRHIKLNHRGKDVRRSRTLTACLRCRNRKTQCDGNLPCNFCLSKGIKCVYPSSSGPGMPLPGGAGQSASPSTSPSARERSSDDIERHIAAYFKHFHPTWSFLHKTTFHPQRETPMLVQTVVMIGLWASGAPEQQRAALDIQQRLAASILQQRAKWDVSSSSSSSPSSPSASSSFPPSWPISTYQGILLNLIFALATSSNASAKPSSSSSTPNYSPRRLSPANYDILVALTKSCLRRGMLSYPQMLAQFDQHFAVVAAESADAACRAAMPHAAGALYIWVGVEEAKRFALALWTVWRMCHGGGDEEGERAGVGGQAEEEESSGVGGSSGDGEAATVLSLKDLQFPMPASDYLWNAETPPDLLQRLRAEWNADSSVDLRTMLAKEIERAAAMCGDEGAWICNSSSQQPGQ